MKITDLQKGSSEYDPRDFWVVPGTGVKICLNKKKGETPYYSLEGGEWVRVVIRYAFTGKEFKRQFASMQEALNYHNENMK